MTYDLPLPPSVNALYKNTPHGRAKTNNYLEWITLARSALCKQKARPLFGAYHLTYLVTEKSRIDLGNHEKPLTDLLVFHGILENDSKQFVRGISLEWSSEIEGVRVIIEPATEKRKEAA